MPPAEPDATPGLDPWGLLGLPGQVSAATFLTSQYAHQYRLIVAVLADQRSQSLTGVSHDDVGRLVAERLPAQSAPTLIDQLNLDERLDQLVRWGACESWQDKATTEADFLRNRARYQLTEAGAALHEVAISLDTELGVGSTAALMAPATLADRVEATLAALAADDPRGAQDAYSVVQTTLSDMARTAGIWQSKLAAALGGAPDEDKVTRLLETILAYVEAWGSGIDAYSERIAAGVPLLVAQPAAVWRRVALARVGAEAADHTVRDVVDELTRVATTLAGWFCPPQPQAGRLRRQMRDAIAPVLRSHRTLLAVGGTVSRQADLTRLARAVEAAADAEAAWDLWCRATGLFPARHYTQTTEGLDVAAEAQTSVWDAPPASISRRLRALGQRSVVARPARLADMAVARQAARQAAARDRVDRARAEAELAARSGTALSAWAPLDAPAAELFLTLLSAAREHRAGDGVAQGTSPDGRWTVRLTSLAPATAVVRTPDGRLALPDAIVEITA
jgi:uncharacterized protein (TIGR02677 family)